MNNPDIMNTVVVEPKSGNAKNMVIFLHGYGSNKDDLISIGREWGESLPDTVFLSPNAPQKCEMMMWGEAYEWFPLRSVDVKQIEEEKLFENAFVSLNNYIDAKLAEWGISEENLAVVGFSQGAMMAMYTMPRRNNKCAGIIAYSGLLIGEKGLSSDDVKKFPMLVMHGADDDVVPPANLSSVCDGFTKAGFDIESIMRPNLGHGIDMFGITRGAEFIKECFAK